MTEAQIKEKISEHFIGIIAASSGYKMIYPQDDHGVDFMIKETQAYTVNNTIRYVDAGRMIGVQLKCTSKSQVLFTDKKIRFDLPIKNYNDLIWRKQNSIKVIGAHIPLILILVILQNDSPDWITFSEEKDKLIIEGKAFWFYPEEVSEFTGNKYQKRIDIPISNQIELDFFEKIINLFYKN